MIADSRPAPQPGILDIKPYEPGKSWLPGDGPVIKLSSNETPLGPSPEALAAYNSAARQLDRYPDRSAEKLRAAIGGEFGLNAANIVCGAGSDELLHLLAQAYLGPGDEAIYTEHGFLVYPIAITSAGAMPVVAPETEHRADVDAILGKTGPRTRAVFLANPNNPTGTYLPFDEIQRLRQELPGNVLLVLDAAYAEYVRRNDYEAGIELVSNTDNTVMTRTFSKLYGLAGLRLGWAYCPSGIADVLNRIRCPFNISDPAIEAGVAALGDSSHRDRAVAHNETFLPWLHERLKGMGLKVTPSAANFLLVHFPQEPEHSAAQADAFLMEKRILLRRIDKYGLPHALRLTVGTETENQAVIEALSEFMHA